MGSLESGIPLKRTPLLRSCPSSGSNRSFFHRPRSRLARFLLFEKVDYIQWICTAAAFFFVVILFQAFLPGSVVEKSGGEVEESDGAILKGIRGLDFGEGISFMPTRLMEKWERERREANATSLGREVKRFGLKRPKIALVVAGLWADGVQLEMVSVAAALKEIGYDIQVYSLKDGPIHAAWKTLGMPCIILSMDIKCEVTVDWSDYNGIVISSIDARPAISCLPYRKEDEQLPWVLELLKNEWSPKNIPEHSNVDYSVCWPSASRIIVAIDEDKHTFLS